MATEPSRRPTAWLSGVGCRLGRPVDPASLAGFRIAFGLLLLAAVIRFAADGRIGEHFVEPQHFFHYSGFGWLRPLPAPGMHILYVGLGLLAIAIAAGAWTRGAAALFGLLFGYAHLCDKTHYLNHYYLVTLLAFLLALVPTERAASVDAWRARRRGRPLPPMAPGWAVDLLRLQLAIVYFYGGVAKLGGDWLLHAEPLRIWFAARPDTPLVGALMSAPWLAYAASWAAAAFDLTIAGWLSWRRTRPAAYAVLVGFHVATAALFTIGLFPWLMIGLTPIFFDPAWPRRLGARLGLRPRAAAAPATPPLLAPAAAPRRRAAALLAPLLGLHLALQLLLPLRHFLYPGNVLWTEEGFRLAWKVMVMEKSGQVDFRVRDPDNGRSWMVSPRRFYTRYQAGMMSTQPDMILEAAHLVAADARGQGVRRPEVYADAFASLDGRPRQRLIDPTVDLARERGGLEPWPWILPLAEGTPP